MPSVKFSTFIPELTELMPIKKAKINDFAWYQRMVQEFQAMHPRPESHTSRCPGIISICNQGWIQCAYQDFSITTRGDGINFDWRTEIDQAALPTIGSILKDYISYHTQSQLFRFNRFKKATLETIVKIQSPWMVEVPEGYCLISMPVPYNDNNHFTALHGIIKDTNWLNIQLMWHTLSGEIVITKGTPLCQYVLVKDESVDWTVEPIDDRVTLMKLLAMK